MSFFYPHPALSLRERENTNPHPALSLRERGNANPHPGPLPQGEGERRAVPNT